METLQRPDGGFTSRHIDKIRVTNGREKQTLSQYIQKLRFTRAVNNTLPLVPYPIVTEPANRGSAQYPQQNILYAFSQALFSVGEYHITAHQQFAGLQELQKEDTSFRLSTDGWLYTNERPGQQYYSQADAARFARFAAPLMDANNPEYREDYNGLVTLFANQFVDQTGDAEVFDLRILEILNQKSGLFSLNQDVSLFPWIDIMLDLSYAVDGLGELTQIVTECLWVASIAITGRTCREILTSQVGVEVTYTLRYYGENSMLTSRRHDSPAYDLIQHEFLAKFLAITLQAVKAIKDRTGATTLMDYITLPVNRDMRTPTPTPNVSGIKQETQDVVMPFAEMYAIYSNLSYDIMGYEGREISRAHASQYLNYYKRLQELHNDMEAKYQTDIIGSNIEFLRKNVDVKMRDLNLYDQAHSSSTSADE
ncbi:protein 7 [Thyrinteina arnobia cypovirus 14]|nr:protein 7 [Thyrinteina arnobia cypovirus 14]